MAFVYFNPNPNGKSVGDCTIRAISLLMDRDWRKTYIGLATMGFSECDMPSSNAVWGKYLAGNGYDRGIIPDTCPYCYTIDDFCKDNPVGKFMLATGKHVVTIIDGNYYDTWDSGHLIPLYYWFKRED